MALAGDRPPSNTHGGAVRLGVFGGTFDPIHIGHLIVAEEARACLGLLRVLFVPANVSPIKNQGTLGTGEERYQQVQMAVADNPHLIVSRVDLDRRGPSYSVDTLRALQEQYGARTQLHFVMGTDSLLTFPAWHRPAEILRLTRLAVFTRPGYDVDWESLEAQVPGLRRATDLITTLNIGISSTDLRRRIQSGLPIRYQVPASVEASILGYHRTEKTEHVADASCF